MRLLLRTRKLAIYRLMLSSPQYSHLGCAAPSLTRGTAQHNTVPDDGTTDCATVRRYSHRSGIPLDSLWLTAPRRRRVQHCSERTVGSALAFLRAARGNGTDAQPQAVRMGYSLTGMAWDCMAAARVRGSAKASHSLSGNTDCGQQQWRRQWQCSQWTTADWQVHVGAPALPHGLRVHGGAAAAASLQLDQPVCRPGRRCVP